MAICSVIEGIASHELNTCAMPCRVRHWRYSSRNHCLFRISMAYGQPGQFVEKPVEVGNEIAAMFVIRGPEPGKLEHEDADFGADFFAWFQECVREEVGVEEVRVRVACFGAETGEIGKFLDGDGVGDLEAELKIVGHLISEFVEIIGAREIIVGGIDADGIEDFGVFAEAIPFEACFGELATILVAAG